MGFYPRESELGEIGRDLNKKSTFYKSKISEGLFNTIPSIDKLTTAKQSEFESSWTIIKSEYE
jgi:hypothetical protein